MARLVLRVLGDLQVLIDDVPIQLFESDKVRALLAYVAVEASRPHSREALIGLLWPDYPEEAARHNLRQALFNLRLALGDHTAKPPYLLVSRNSIQFNRQSSYSLDIAQFNETFVAWKKAYDHKSSVSSMISQLQEMVDLYHGEFLQHFYIADSAAFEDWIVVQRETMRQRLMDALVYLSNEHTLLGEYEAARRYAARQLELDPWREEAHSQIMRVLALGGQRSAALAQYENCKRILAEELGVEPSAKTRDLYEQIRLGTMKAKEKPQIEIPVAPIHNIPVSLTPFFGREQELTHLSQLIVDPNCRCITLVGTGGIGKTRLALQSANQHRHRFVHGSAFIPLASIGSINAVIPTIANAIHFAFCGPTDPKIQLLNYLRDKKMLLIIDNVEHLLVESTEGVTIVELLIEILQQAAGIKLIVTSREALNVQGEWLVEIQGLAFPKTGHTNNEDEYSAVGLFIQRARRACPEWVLNDEDKIGVVQICHLVGGMPLALELAAPWVKLLSPREIAIEIEKSLDFLHTQMRDVPERHRSMRVIFDHSWQTLTMEEKQILSRLSVFRGGFQRQAAEQVTGASLSVLSMLMTRSLLRRTVNGRYDIHELIQQYAASKLAEDPKELKALQEQHSLYYLGLLAERDSQLKGKDQQEILVELTKEIDNIRTAWDWSVSNQNFLPLYTVAFTLSYMLALHNWFREGEATFWKTSQALDLNLRAVGQENSMLKIASYAMLAHCGYFRLCLGQAEEAFAILAPSAAFLRTSADPSTVIYSLWYLGFAYLQLGRFSEAKENLLECLAISRKYGASWFQALADEFLGSLARGEGTYSQARAYLKEALDYFHQIGDPMMTSHVLSDLGYTLLFLGDLDQAERLLQEGLDIARELDYCRFGVGLALNGLGQVAYARGDHERAHAFFSESASLFQQIGDTHRLTQVLNYEGLNALALDRTIEARKDFCNALKLAQQSGLIPSMLDALIGLAIVDSRQRANQEALELVLYILQNPASAQKTKDLARQLQVELQDKLTQEEIETAHRKTGSKSMDEFVQQFLGNI